jgi:hypothetical protein
MPKPTSGFGSLETVRRRARQGASPGAQKETNVTETLAPAQAAKAGSLHVGTRVFEIFAALLYALHEARRRQAERDIRRHQYLLDRYASPQLREQFADPSSGHWVVSGLTPQRR